MGKFWIKLLEVGHKQVGIVSKTKAHVFFE